MQSVPVVGCGVDAEAALVEQSNAQSAVEALAERCVHATAGCVDF